MSVLPWIAALAVVVLAACGDGGESPADDDGSSSDGSAAGGPSDSGAPGTMGDFEPPMAGAAPPPTSPPVHCDGAMLYGSSRWCILDDGTAKDMTSNVVWMREADCYRNSNAYFRIKYSLADGTCNLADGSSEGDWALPNFGFLKSLCLGEDEPVTLKNPRVFNNLRNVNWADESWDSVSMDGPFTWYGYIAFDGSDPRHFCGNWFVDSSEWEGTGSLAYRRYPDPPPVTAITPGKSYALAGWTATLPVPGKAHWFTRRFLTQDSRSVAVLWEWDYSPAYRSQRIWTFDAEKDGAGNATGYFRIHTRPPLGAWGYLAVENASTSPGARVVTWNAEGGNNHLWAPVYLGSGSAWAFVNKASGLCLQWQNNVNGEALVQQYCETGSPGPNQTFLLIARR